MNADGPRRYALVLDQLWSTIGSDPQHWQPLPKGKGRSWWLMGSGPVASSLQKCLQFHWQPLDKSLTKPQAICNRGSQVGHTGHTHMNHFQPGYTSITASKLPDAVPKGRLGRGRSPKPRRCRCTETMLCGVVGTQKLMIPSSKLRVSYGQWLLLIGTASINEPFARAIFR